jgi:hypothetical protein
MYSTVLRAEADFDFPCKVIRYIIFIIESYTELAKAMQYICSTVASEIGFRLEH